MSVVGCHITGWRMHSPTLISGSSGPATTLTLGPGTHVMPAPVLLGHVGETAHIYHKIIAYCHVSQTIMTSMVAEIWNYLVQYPNLSSP